MNYTKLLKNGLTLCNHQLLQNYLEDAVTYHERHELISAINRDEWPSFNHQNKFTHQWTPYVITLNEDLNRFDLYRIYGLDQKEVAQVPVKDVLSQETLQKYHFPSVKPTSKKSTNKKVNTVKHRKKSTTSRKKPAKKSKISKKGSRSHSKRNKK